MSSSYIPFQPAGKPEEIECPTREAARQYTEEEWEEQKERFEKLYIGEGLALKDAANKMELLYGFSATRKQYKTRIQKWRLPKYRRKEEMEALVLEMTSGPSTVPATILLSEKRNIQRYLRRKKRCTQRKRTSGSTSCITSTESPETQSAHNESPMPPQSGQIAVHQPTARIDSENIVQVANFHSPRPGLDSFNPLSPIIHRAGLSPTFVPPLAQLSVAWIERMYNKSIDEIIVNRYRRRTQRWDPTADECRTIFVAQVFFHMWKRMPKTIVFANHLWHWITPPNELIQLVYHVRQLHQSVILPPETVLASVVYLEQLYDSRLSLLQSSSYDPWGWITPKQMLAAILRRADRDLNSPPYSNTTWEAKTNIPTSTLDLVETEFHRMTNFSRFGNPERSSHSYFSNFDLTISNIRECLMPYISEPVGEVTPPAPSDDATNTTPMIGPVDDFDTLPADFDFNATLSNWSCLDSFSLVLWSEPLGRDSIDAIPANSSYPWAR